MKKLVLSAMILFTGVLALAQRGEGYRGRLQELSPTQMANLHTKKMTLALDLDTSQQAQVQAIHLEAAQRRKAKMGSRNNRGGTNDRSELSAEDRYNRKMEQLDRKIAEKAKMIPKASNGDESVVAPVFIF